METIGASFKIDINNLKAGLTTANKLIRESQSQFKAAAAGLDSFSDAQKISESKIKSLNEIIPIQEKKVQALKDQYQKLVDDGLDETSDRAIYLRTQINKETESLEKNKKELKNLEDSSEDAGDELEDLGDEAEKTSGSFTVMKGALANLVADGFRMAIQAAKDFAKEMVNVGMTFDDSMAQVAAVSGAAGDDLEKLRNKAKEMGSTTKFTASEAADAFNYMAMAGWKTEDMLGGIEGILNLAAASGSDLATTSDIVTDALTAMGYEAKDAGRLADVMAAASSNANTNVEMMGQTFQYAAPLVGALGYNMEDTAVAIGLMANSGIKGEKAGTALRSMLTRLASPPKACSESMEELGISITDSEGKMKSLETVMVELREKFATLDETQQAHHASNIAGQEAMSGLLAIVNAAPADFDKLTEAVAKSEGAAQNMSDTMLDTLGGDMTVLQSQIEGVRLEIYEELEPTLRGFVGEAQKAIKKINWKKVGTEAKNILKKLADTAKSFAKNVLPTVKKALEVVGKALKFVVDNFEWLSKVVLGAVAAFQAFKAVMAITTAITAAKTAIAGLSAGVGIATKAQVGWNAAMSANPIGAVITAVALLAVGLGILITKMSEQAEAADPLNRKYKEQQEKANELTSELNEMNQAYKDLKAEKQEQLNASQSEFRYYQDLWNELQGIIDQNGKVQEGYEARAQYIADALNEGLGLEIQFVDGVMQQYDELSKSIDDVIEKQRYQAILAINQESFKTATEEQEKQARVVRDANKALEDQQELIAELQGAYEAAQAKVDSALTTNSKNDFAVSNATIAANQAKEKLDNAKKTLAELTSARNDAQTVLEGYLYDIAIYEQNYANFQAGNYDKMITNTWEYVNSFKDAEDAKKAMLEDDVEVTDVQLAALKSLYAQTGDEIVKNMIDNYEKQKEEQEKSLEAYNSATESGLNANSLIWQGATETILGNITGKNIDFFNAGNGLVQMMIDGQKAGEPLAADEMTSIVQNVIQKVIDGEIDAKEAGENLIEGVNSGIKNQNKQNSVFSSIATFGSNLLSRLKQSVQEQSPSKATRKMGQFLVEGMTLGIKDEEKSAIRQVSSFGESVLSAFQNQVGDLNGNYDLSGMMGAVGNGGNKMVTVNQYNTYSQAHSRYELYKTKQQTAAAVRLALGTV